MQMATLLPSLLTLPEAARKYGLEERRLRALIKAGKMHASTFMGEVLVSEQEIQETKTARKEDLPEYKHFIHLIGVGIGIAEAARKYDLATSTVHGWTQAGYVARIGKDGQKILIDEADVAYCAEIYRKVGSRGRRLFAPDGTPYKPKTGPLAG